MTDITSSPDMDPELSAETPAAGETPVTGESPEEFLPDAPDTLEEQADAEQPYGEVTAQDLSTDDLVQDGADLMTGGPELTDAVMNDDPRSEETIDERLAQEEFDPTSAIVPATDVDLTEEDVINEAELEGDVPELDELEVEDGAADAAADEAARDASQDALEQDGTEQA